MPLRRADNATPVSSFGSNSKFQFCFLVLGWVYCVFPDIVYFILVSCFCKCVLHQGAYSLVSLPVATEDFTFLWLLPRLQIKTNKQTKKTTTFGSNIKSFTGGVKFLPAVPCYGCFSVLIKYTRWYPYGGVKGGDLLRF